MEPWKAIMICDFDTRAQENSLGTAYYTGIFPYVISKDLDDITFTVEKYPYRRRKNLLVIYRGLRSF